MHEAKEDGRAADIAARLLVDRGRDETGPVGVLNCLPSDPGSGGTRPSGLDGRVPSSEHGPVPLGKDGLARLPVVLDRRRLAGDDVVGPAYTK